MTTQEIYAIAPRPDGWRVLPDGKWIKVGLNVKLGNYVTLGNRVTLGDNVTLGNNVKLGNGVTLGDNVKLGNFVTLGDNVKLGNSVTLGDSVTLGNQVKLGNRVTLGNFVTLGNNVTLGYSVTLGNFVTLGNDVKLGDNETSEKLNLQAIEEYKRIAPKHIFCKWVDKNRMSPFKGSIIYNVGETIIDEKAIVSEVQCSEGLHVFRIGFRPEWAGLCDAGHELIKIDVEVASEDICFAGIADMNQKLRVKKLKVLN